MTALLPTKCPLCRSDITGNAEVRAALLLEAAVADENRSYSQGGSWDWWESRDLESPVYMGTQLGNVSVVARHIPYGEEQGNDARVAYMVFDVDGTLIRKDGVTDSYGDTTYWTGPLRPVQRVEKQITTYDYQ